MLICVVPNKVCKHRGDTQEETETSRNPEFLRMNRPSFAGLITTKKPKNFIEELKKVFDVMHVADVERVELTPYQLKYMARP